VTGYDAFALVVILASAAAGWVRGGTRELITLLSFVLAAIIALIALPISAPIGRSIIDPDWAGSIAAAVVVFLLIYFGIRIFGSRLSRAMQAHQHLSGVDRVFGIVIGAARALVLLGAIHLVFHAATPAERVPVWFREAAVFPVSERAARVIQFVLPGIGRGADALTPVIGSSVSRGFSNSNSRDGVSRAPQSETTSPAPS
jgi:membrane protein required for colicin V production